jgi:hypothetical protein
MRLRFGRFGVHDLEAQFHIAESDFVPVTRMSDNHTLAVEVRAIGGMQIPELVLATIQREHGMVLGDAGVIEANVIIGRPPDVHARSRDIKRALRQD